MRAGLAALALALPAMTSGARLQAPPAAQDPADARVRETLERLLADTAADPDRAPDSLEVALSDHGAPAIAPLVDLLAEGAYLRREDGAEPTRTDLAPAERRSLLRALARLPRADVRRHLEVIASSAPGPALRGAGLAVVAEVGDGGDVLLAARLAGPPERDARIDPLLRRDFGQACAGIFARHSSAHTGLRPVFADIQVALRSAVLDALDETDDQAVMTTLAALAGHSESMDGLVLRALQKQAARFGPIGDDYVAMTVRGYVTSPDRQIASCAILTAGHLCDPQVVDQLIEILDGADENRAALAHAALVEISGLEYPLARSHWDRWYSEERRWRERQAPFVFRSLHSPSRAAVLESIRELSMRRLYRHESVEQLIPLLWHESMAVRVLTCEVLGHLGSMLATPHLETILLEERSDLLRDAAGRSLEKITGEPHPPQNPGPSR